MSVLHRLVAHIADLLTLAWEHVRDLFVEAHMIDGYDFDFITSRVATGAAPVDQGFVDALVNAGITHIIDVTDAEDDRSLLASHPAIIYLYNPTADDGTHKPVSWFKTSLDFALPALTQANTKVYAHCTAGKNRGPSTAYCILRAGGLSKDEVWALFKEHRPQATINYAADAEVALTALGYK